jgi:hypothetical protein
MRARTQLFVLALGLAALGPSAAARAAPPAAPVESPCLPDRFGPPGARMFHKLDPAGHGWVGLDAFVAHREGRFHSLDADHDGRVTRAEFMDAHTPAQRPAAEASFARFDTDHDGVITQSEWDAGETRRFQRIDTNHDGRVTREEFLADRAKVCRARAKAAPGASGKPEAAAPGS